MPGKRPPNHAAAFTLVELLVVMAIIGVLIALLLPALGRAREAAQRIQCAVNLRAFGQGLHAYGGIYGRYPHQRQVRGDLQAPDGRISLWGGPLLPGLNVEANPISGVGWEFDEVLAQGLGVDFERRASAPLPPEAQTLACGPTFRVARDTEQPNGTGNFGRLDTATDTDYLWILGYFYTGGSDFWTSVAEPMSPITPDDDPGLTLAADIAIHDATRDEWLFVAHRAAEGIPAGSNHLFNDGAVRWVPWSGGSNMGLVTSWIPGAPVRDCYWRRRVEGK